MEGIIVTLSLAFAVTSPVLIKQMQEEIERKKIFMIQKSNFISKRTKYRR